MILGWDAPLPPARTGVADYAATLLRALRQRTSVAVAGQRADRWVYHIGNNHLHRDIYRRALRAPDAVVLHDAVLMHFFLGSLDEASFVQEFVYNYGTWHEEFARDLWRRRAASGASAEFFRYPMLKRIAEAARVVIVHNSIAARMVRESAPGARIVEIPHLWEAPIPTPAERIIAWRQSHRIAPGEYLFGVFGYLRETKRLLPVLRAFSRIEGARLLLAGEFGSTALERAVAPWLDHPALIRIGATNDADFQLLTEVVDCGINLRYPSAGETSGITIRLMGLGKPVLLTDNEETAALPAATCLPIAQGLGEELALFEMMHWLVANPGQGRAIGRRAAYYIAQRHSLAPVVDQYLQAVA